MLHKFYLFRIQAFALSWICSSLTEFRNCAYRQSLLNLFAIRTNVRTQIRSARSSLEPKTRLTPCDSRHKHNKRVGDKHHQLFYGLRGARLNRRRATRALRGRMPEWVEPFNIFQTEKY